MLSSCWAAAEQLLSKWWRAAEQLLSSCWTAAHGLGIGLGIGMGLGLSIGMGMSLSLALQAPPMTNLGGHARNWTRQELNPLIFRELSKDLKAKLYHQARWAAGWRAQAHNLTWLKTMVWMGTWTRFDDKSKKKHLGHTFHQSYHTSLV